MIKPNLKFIFALLFFSFPLCVHSQFLQYSMTENQFKTLEVIQQSQKQLIEDLQNQSKNQKELLENYQEQMRILNESLKKSEKKIEIKNNFLSVTLGISVGCIAGLIAYQTLGR